MLHSLGTAACLVATLSAPVPELRAPLDETLTIDAAAGGVLHLPLRLPDSWQWGDPVVVLDGDAPSIERVALAWDVAVVRVAPGVDAGGPSTQAWFEGALAAVLCGGG